MSAASVGVVVVNDGPLRHLPVALGSLRQQTHAPAEIVVVHCGAGAFEEVAAAAREHGARCVRHEGGVAAARNLGVAELATDLVAFLAADDWFGPDKLERALEELASLGAGCLATDAWLVLGDRVAERQNDGADIPMVLTQERLIRGNPIVCSTVVVRRELVAEAGGFDENPDLAGLADYDLWLRLADREPLAYLGEPLTFHRAAGSELGSEPTAEDRFLQALEIALRKVGEQHAGESHFVQLIAQRQAASRLDLAEARLGAGDRAGARRLLREARGFARSWRASRLWLRAMLPRGAASSRVASGGRE